MPMRRKLLAAVGFCLSVFIQVAAALPQNRECDLPQDLQREIASKYSGMKVVTLSDLQEDDRAFFQKDHGNSCPGSVKVNFYGDGNPTLALVLIANEKSELIVAHQVGESWRSTVLETGGPSVPVVWSLPSGKYTDVYGKKTIRATRPVIVFFQYEAWGILYAWTGNAVSKIWIAD
jgi:hypothetical protein